jgi:hypothetical protein
MLSAAVRDGRLRCERTADGGYLFSPVELAEDLTALACRYDGCSRVAIGPTGRCSEHRWLGRTHSTETRQKMSAAMSGERHHRAWLGRRHTPETRHKMSQTAMGRPVTEDARRKISAALTIYPAESRSCEWCRIPLGVVWGSRLIRGEGRFCCPSHHKLWEWENEPRRFDNLVKNGWPLAAVGRFFGPLATEIAGQRGKSVGRKVPSAEALLIAQKELELLKLGTDPEQIVDVLIVRFKGRDAVKFSSGERRPKRDVTYRAARAWVERRLRDGRPLLSGVHVNPPSPYT